MKALILCAGLGTRLGLKHKPKCMAMVNGKPIVKRIVDNLVRWGFTEIAINLYKNPDKVIEYFIKNAPEYKHKVRFYIEEFPMGKEKTIKYLKSWLGKRYMILNGDTLFDFDLTEMMEYPASRLVNPINGHFGGIEIVNGRRPQKDYYGYYFDCNTPAKLAKARRYFKKHE